MGNEPIYGHTQYAGGGEEKAQTATMVSPSIPPHQRLIEAHFRNHKEVMTALQHLLDRLDPIPTEVENKPPEVSPQRTLVQVLHASDDIHQTTDMQLALINEIRNKLFGGNE